jgi:hypothetical protein
MKRWGKKMLQSLMIFKNFEVFKAYFKNSRDPREQVVKLGWHHFNMQAVVYVTGLAIFNSLKMPEVVIYLGMGFLILTGLIYANTKRNIQFSEQLAN